MPYNPLTDFIGLWRAVSGGVEKAEMPGLDFVIQALSRAGLVRVVTSATAPIANQASTAWFKPAIPSYAGEGTLFLWDKNILSYGVATPELYHALMTSSSEIPGGGGGGDGGIEEAPIDGKQYGRQNAAWTEITGSTPLPPGGDTDMAIISPTPPATPTAGLQWWDGNIMKVWDGSIWQDVGPTVGPGGDPLETTALVFSMTQPAAMTVTASVWTIAPYVASPVVDTIPGSWDAVTKKYTPKKPGFYTFNARGIPNGAGAGIAILKNDDGTFNGATGSDVVIAMGTAPSTVWQSVSGSTQMNGTTDYVRVYVFCTTASMAAAGSNPIFSALRLP